jgi:hypothetical protein
MIGKVKTDPTGSDPVGLAMAAMAILGRTGKRRFNRAPVPAHGVPAMAGDGTASRATDAGWVDATTDAEKIGRVRHWISVQ